MLLEDCAQYANSTEDILATCIQEGSHIDSEVKKIIQLFLYVRFAYEEEYTEDI